jgi:integrase
LVRGALAAAIDEEYIEENPALGIKLPKEARVDDLSTVLTPSEQERLLDVVPLPEEWIVAAAIGGGWRMGEQWSLELADVHIEVAVPYVDVRYGAVNRKPTKNGQPRRVPLVGPALEAMREWLRIRDDWCNHRRCALVYPTPRAAHRRKKPPRGWKEWLRKAGIVRRVRWHDLRHTCASALLSGQWGRKWSMEEVQKFLGHKSIRTTERYARFADDALMRAAAETTAAIAASKRAS